VSPLKSRKRRFETPVKLSSSKVNLRMLKRLGVDIESAEIARFTDWAEATGTERLSPGISKEAEASLLNSSCQSSAMDFTPSPGQQTPTE
jgi:hypothetical protein